MSWDKSLGEIFATSCGSIVDALVDVASTLKAILAELQAQGKKIK